ncbi:CRISPR-associated protein Cas4 [Acetobacter tropicalis NRIC 0312]|uniref:CRISPR-associated exonuclease Cas4 n=1 Tax=Acetobacter tropicalis TaxID=104102 RepID=A0A511FP52_9PROT|nr:CRISPR-associated protein Cas4 [Acetobacter tropicalis]GAL96392.1 CRISPR-associated protein Cas4 [Acetobacter tropicalis]GBR71999.1 CRISPR-associated protein Cas4 [Acetobacter tropicalis NRIC 0312]GEL50726.1 CRISPR-associated protein Cas4 [Acetobacter tropicalis]
MMPEPKAQEEEDRLVPISALQHYLFCPRQCALIHVEQQWAENGATAEGRILHETVDAGLPERRRGVKILRAVPLRSFLLGVFGKADVVELHGKGEMARPYPVECKRCSLKPHRADEVQLCAQAQCLEEMFGCPVPEGALFYGRPHRRTIVVFDENLRALTRDIAQTVQALFASGQTPPPVWRKACGQCSLEEMCQPRRLEKKASAQAWFLKTLES